MVLESNAMMYGVKMPSGLWLNNEYHKRISRSYGPDASPHPEEHTEPRLFASPAGARSSLGQRVTPSIRKLLPEEVRDWQRPAWGERWTEEDHRMNRLFWKAAQAVFKSLKGQAYWDMLAKDGYILTEFKIKEIS